MTIIEQLKKSRFLNLPGIGTPKVQEDETDGIYVQSKSLSSWILQSPRFKIRPNAKSLAMAGGQYLSKLRGRGVDFSEVRLYQAGDDIRSIDWRVTARTSKPHTKLYEEERERPVVLVVDQSPNLFFGSQYVFKSFLAARLSALIGYHAVRQGDRLGSLLFNHERILDLPARRGQQSWQVFCRHLTEFNHHLTPKTIQQKALPWQKIISHLQHSIRPGTLVILISDFSEHFAEAGASLSRLKKHNDVIAIHVSDPMEKALPAQFARYTDGQETLSVNGHDKGFRSKFKENHEAYMNQVTKVCKKNAVPLIQMSTADDPYTIAHYLDRKPGR